MSRQQRQYDQQPQQGSYSSMAGQQSNDSSQSPFAGYSMATSNAGMAAPPRGNGAPTPARPARSQRRPMGHAVTDSRDSTASLSIDYAAGPGMMQQQQQQQRRAPPAPAITAPTLAPNPSTSSSNGQSSRAARLAQAIQQEERHRPGDRRASFSDDDLDNSMVVEDQSPPPHLPKQQLAMRNAIAAFSNAGAAAKSRSDSNDNLSNRSRANSPTNVMNRDRSDSGLAGKEGGGRTRRGAVGVQGESARMKKGQKAAIPSTPAFREMERVLAQVTADWPELLPPSVREDQVGNDENGEDVFDPVTLALTLVAPDASPDRFRNFMATKEALSRSLKSSIQTHYRAFDASVSAYNGLLSNLSAAQKNTSSLRSTLDDVRTTLGKARTELGVLEARRTELAEMDKILASIETLRNVPDTLESLTSEKRFLPATALLVKSLKTVNKPDLVEIAATADLRSYFVSQENLMLEYLAEELHSHLYLKSFYTEARWKNYTPGQTDLPAFLVENTFKSIFDYPRNKLTNGNDSDPGTPKKQTKLDQYLLQLSQRSSTALNLEELLDNEGQPDVQGQGSGNGDDNLGVTASASSRSLGVPRSSSNGTMDGMAGFNPTNGHTSASNKANPEQDSFAYIETLLESLTHFGKLSFAMDSVLQRAPIEIYNLIESTIAEVDERNDPVRRNSIRLAKFGTSGVSPKMTYSGSFPASNASNSVAYSLLVRSSIGGTNLAALDESGLSASLNETNTSILLDFFWTLFSKLDAVLQGFRVMHEVVQRIASRPDFKDSAMTNRQGRLVYSLTDIWKPIQVEIQALLHDYLIDEQGGATSSKSAVASINETLRSGRPMRDQKKNLFKFGETDGKASSRRLRPYEDALNRSLKQSVPGLVSSLAEGVPTVFSAGVVAPSAQAKSADGLKNGNTSSTGRTHRMLVSPTAFSAEALVAPTMRFLERAKTTLTDAVVTGGADKVDNPAHKRYSGLMDDETVDKLQPVLSEWHKKHESVSGKQTLEVPT